MSNPDLLRKLSLAAMIIAIVAGLISLFLLFTSPTRDMTMGIVSIAALVVGLLIDRRAGKLDDRNAR